MPRFKTVLDILDAADRTRLLKKPLQVPKFKVLDPHRDLLLKQLEALGSPKGSDENDT